METLNNHPEGRSNGRALPEGESPIWQPDRAPKSSHKKGRMLAFAALLGSHKRLVVGSAIVGALLFFLLTYALRETYTSQVSMLPPEKGAGGSLMSFLSGSGAGGALEMLGGGASNNPEMDLYKSILESRTIAEEVANDPRVTRYFSTFDTGRLAIMGMASETITSEASRNNIMTLTVALPTHAMPSAAERDTARVMSAYLANLYVHALDRFNRERLMTSARNTRQFIEKEYNDRMAHLDTAYDRLQQFQESNQAISLTDQLTATVSSAAQLGSSVQELEMQIGVEERELSPNSTRIEMLKSQLQEAKAMLAKYDNGGAGEYVLALKDVPALTREYAKYFKEVKLLETVTSYLRQQLEQERISEQRDLPSLQVLDAAVPPQKRSSPKRSTMTAIGLLAGFFMGIIIAAIKNFQSDVRDNPEGHIHYLKFKSALLGRKGALAAGGVLKETQVERREYV